VSTEKTNFIAEKKAYYQNIRSEYEKKNQKVELISLEEARNNAFQAIGRKINQ
jgi:hypothetical protein